MAIAADIDQDTLNSIIKRSLLTSKSEIISNKEVVKVSTTLTSLQNAFNKIFTSTLNVKNIQKLEEKRLQNIKKEVAMETRVISSPAQAGALEFEAGSTIEAFSKLNKTILDFTKNLDKLNLQPQESVSGDIDIDSNRRGKGRKGLGRFGKIAGGLAVGAAALYGLNAAAGMFGVGQTNEDLDKQDDINWRRSSRVEKLQSSIPRGIEKVGAGIGLGSIAKQGQAERVKSETKYLNDVARRTATMQGKIEQGAPLGASSFSARFSDFIRDNISNMSAWAMASGGAISALAGAYNLAKSIFDRGGGGISGGGGATGSWDGAAVEFDGDVNKILATIRTVESGGDYSTPKPKGMAGTASGAYSFIDKTWKSLTKKYRIGTQYSKAYLAPPAIQDAVAGMYVQEILKNVNNDVSRVPVVWYTGNYKGQLSAEAQGINKGLAVSTYQQKWLSAYAGLGGKINTNASTWKGSGKITSGFGMRRHPVTGVMRRHEGVDIDGETGDPVGAAYPGTIIRAGQLSGYGLVVDINHGKGAVTRYAHLSSIRVHKGQEVSAGDRIGDVGETGLGTGSHLHYELIYNGEPVNSRESFLQRKEFITGAGSTKGKEITPTPAKNKATINPALFTNQSQRDMYSPMFISPKASNPPVSSRSQKPTMEAVLARK